MYLSLKYHIRKEKEHEKNSNKEKETFFKILCDESHKNTFLQFFSAKKKSENPG